MYTVAGCVSIPTEQISPQIRTDELSDHVHFLAQPALKGRKPRTLESQIARRYLTTRFTEYGLVPYPGTEGYELPFRLGTNVIGLLPGSDPDVNDQIVILAAHYDHVGRTSEGVCLGACDNASGVAALLEIAEQISLADKRPRRSVCFASFDCEEQYTLGSLALTCQDYFDQSRVAAMLNIDLLGRDFLDIVPNSLFVVGTEQYPGLRETVKQAGNQAGLNILPIGTDLVGPRGDHLAFETMLIPVLFFTCGIYKDYHQPTDTPDKLDYSNIKRSAQLEEQASKLAEEHQRLAERLAKLEEKLKGLTQERKIHTGQAEETCSRLEQARTRLDDLKEMLSHSSIEQKSLTGEQQLLQRLQKEMEGYGEGVRALFTDGASREGLEGVAGEIFTTESKYERAMEAALGLRVQSIVARDTDEILKAISRLKESRKGSAIFFSHDLVNGDIKKNAQR